MNVTKTLWNYKAGIGNRRKSVAFFVWEGNGKEHREEYNQAFAK